MISIWPKVPLKSIYKGLYDGPHATPAESDEGAIFLGIKNVTESGRLDLSEIRYIAEADLGKWTKRVIPQKDDIVFSYEATLHRYARIPEGFRGCLGRRMALIRVNPEVANIDFVFCYFLGPIWRCEIEKNILSGATVDRIPLTNVPDFNVYLPPLAIQNKIATILLAYDDLIENNLKRIKLLEEMAQITYEEWFVRLKFPGHDTTPLDSASGLPEGWAKIKLGDCCDITSSKRVFLSDYVERGIPFYRGKEIILKSKNEDLGDVLYISVEKYFEIEKKFGTPKPGDILITAVGTLGFPYLVNERDGKFYFKDGNLIWLRDFKIFTSSSYFICLFKNRTFQSLLDSIAIGSSQKALTIQGIKNLDVVMPSKKVIDEFNDIIIPVLKIIENLLSENQLLKEARDILLPRLMTGMIDVDQLVLPEPFCNPSSSTQEPQAV